MGWSLFFGSGSDAVALSDFVRYSRREKYRICQALKLDMDHGN